VTAFIFQLDRRHQTYFDPEVLKVAPVGRPKIISLVGITASGKSALGIKLAQEFGGEIVSCDSRQVYKGLDIGTAKVTKEEQALIKHHLLDVAEPLKSNTPSAHAATPFSKRGVFNVYDFQKMAYSAIDDILARGKVPILVGGSGLYSRSVVEGYVFAKSVSNVGIASHSLAMTGVRHCEELATKQSLSENKSRYDVLQICLMPPREVVEPLVIKRIDERLAQGMIEETETLIKNGVSKEWLSSLGLEYFWNVEYIDGRIDLAEYKQRLKDKTMQFIKRQRTWFRKEKDTIYLTEPASFHRQSRELISMHLNR